MGMDRASLLAYKANFIRRKVQELIRELNAYGEVDGEVIDNLYKVVDIMSNVEDILYDGL